MIAPTTTLTPQGPADTGYAGDYWQFNIKGKLVRVIQEDTLHTTKNTTSSLDQHFTHIEQAHDGPGIKRLVPWRQIQPVEDTTQDW